MLKNSWIFPIVQSIHLAGIAMMAGTILLRDLHALGMRNKSLSPSWTLTGFAIMFMTGPILFISDIPRYLSNPAFTLKMAILAVALLSHFTVHRTGTKLAAIVSILLWTCVVLCARAIADFDV